jgi:hypothetical protein
VYTTSPDLWPADATHYNGQSRLQDLVEQRRKKQQATTSHVGELKDDKWKYCRLSPSKIPTFIQRNTKSLRELTDPKITIRLVGVGV